MRLIVSRQNIGEQAATVIQQKITSFAPTQHKPFVLGLPTGATVVGMYRCLCDMYRNGQLDFSSVVTFNMDEYVGLSPHDPQSYHFYMKQHLFNHVNLSPSHTHILDGQATDLQAVCDEYERAIKQAGGIHLFLGGVGQNGHLAFNEPGSPFNSRTRPVTLAPNTRQANSRFFNGDVSRVPSQALSVGIGTVLDARELLFLASGEKKAPAIARLSQGEITPAWPITALKTHPNATLLVDEAAATQLTGDVRRNLESQRQQHPNAPMWGITLENNL